jgi:hypothetical protein
MVLACIPACCKKKSTVTYHEDINTMVELDNSVFETEEIDTDQQTVKF